MENLELTIEEKKELEKRGFIVKNNGRYGLFGLINDIIIYLGFFTICGIGIFIAGGIIGLTFIFIIVAKYGVTPDDALISILIEIYFLFIALIGIIPVVNSIHTFWKSGKIFYNKDLIIEYGFIKSMNDIERNNYYLSQIRALMQANNKKLNFHLYIAFLFFILFITIGFGFIEFNALLLVIGLLFLLVIIGKILFQKYNSLYAFGNIGEKIQHLSPRIKEQSKQIQSQFESGINYYVLSTGFDSLSATFSEIISLVLKLEIIETKANRGNLFDSQKYINSLRTDIIEPLKSLRDFLGNQKTLLLESENALMQISIGGSESPGNMELSSKRSELLIRELTESIRELDVMIEEMKKNIY